MTRKTFCGNLLWQSSLTLLAPAQEAQVAVAALQASAQGEGCSGMNADTAYTVNLIQKGLPLLSSIFRHFKQFSQIPWNIPSF